jgi:hypothetical protein
MIRIQFATITQVERVQLKPYPLLVDPDGAIRPQDAWQHDPATLVGFVRGFDTKIMTVWWEDVLKDPQQVVGMFPVIDEHDQWQTFQLAVYTIGPAAVALDGQQRLPNTFRRN